MPGEISEGSMDTILENLHNSNAEMMAKIDEGIIATTDPDEKAIKENIVQEPIISPSLTSDEQSRYRSIGQELFSPILKSLDKLFKKNKNKNLPEEKKEDKNPVADAASQDAITGSNFDFKKLEEIDIDKILNFGDDAGSEIMMIIMLLGIGAMMFISSITDFFSNIWDWIVNFFSPLGDFFDFSNGPLAGVFSMIGGAIEGLWKLVSGVFKALGKAGEWIWNGIKTIFTQFITGPNGILSFGTKIVKGIVEFAGKAFQWFGDLLSNVILGPIKAIFGGAEDTGKKAGEEMVADTKAEADDIVHKQKIAGEAATERAMMSAEEAEKSWASCTAKTREEAAAKAKQVGLAVNNDGTISADAVKSKMAEDMIKRYESEHGKLNDDERAKLIQTVKDNIKINGNSLEISSQEFAAALTSTAKMLDKNSNFNSDALIKLTNGENALYNSMLESANAQGKAMMEIYAQANVANDFNAKTEEEKFLWRMEQAKQNGMLAEFRISEARSMLTLAIETIKNSFNGFKTSLVDTFSQAFANFTNKIRDSIVIKLIPEWVNDYSSNYYHIDRIISKGRLYNIMPLNKEDFKNTAGELTQLAQTNVEMVSKQNDVLDEIRLILAEGTNPTIKLAVQKEIKEQFGEDLSVLNEPENNDNSNNTNTRISEIGQALRSKLYTAVTPLVD